MFPSLSPGSDFRALLHGRTKVSSSELASYVEQWISNDITIPVQSILINVDSSCTVIISSFDDRECQVVSEQPINDNNMPAAIVGGTVSCLLLFLILAGLVIIGLLYMWLRKRRCAYFKPPRYICL